MPTAADIKFYLAVNHPDDDSATAAGVIQDELHATGGAKPELAVMAAADQVEVVSDNAADTTRTVTIEGRLASGALASEVLNLNGTTPAVSTNTYERLLKAEVDAKNATYTVTVRRDGAAGDIGTIGVNEKGIYRSFRKAVSEASQVVRYETVYAKNGHATEALNSAQVTLTSDPATNITMGLAAATGDVGTLTNRKTAPGGVSFVDDDVAQNVPGGDLTAGERIAIYVRQTLGAGAGAQKNTYQLTVDGTSA